MDKTHVYREFFYCSSRASSRALSKAPYIHNASAKWYLRFSGHSQKNKSMINDESKRRALWMSKDQKELVMR